MGHREGRHPLHPLVPAADGHHLREARQFHRPHRRRLRHHDVLGQGAHPRRARRLQLPLRRPARHLRGPRLHGVGSHLLRLYQGRGALHPHGLLLLHRRGAGQEDAASALHEGHRDPGPPRARPVRRRLLRPRDHHPRRRAGVLPHLREGTTSAVSISCSRSRTLFGYHR